MNGLTIWAPWSNAIALSDVAQLGPDRGKGLENREWEPPRRIVGQYIAIHSAKRPCDQGDALEVGKMLYDKPPGRKVGAWFGELVAGYGKILAVALVTGFGRDRRYFVPAQRRWWVGSVGWRLDDVRALPEPIQIRGMQGLWVVPTDVEARIREQVRL